MERWKNEAPDFRNGWQFHQENDFEALNGDEKNPKKIRIGSIKVYFDAQTSDIGCEYYNLLNRILFKVWRRGVKYRDELRIVWHAHYLKKDIKKGIIKKIYRLGNPVLTAAICGENTVIVIIKLITGEEIRETFDYK